MSIDVDTREFQAAMKEAIRTSSRTAADVINWKHAALLGEAKNNAPITDFQHKLNGNDPFDNDPAWITKLATLRFGRGFKRSQRTELWKQWSKKSIGKSFMKSGFALAYKRLKRANNIRKGKSYDAGIPDGKRPIKAHVKHAAGLARVLFSKSEIRYKARPGTDAKAKEKILFEALRKGMAFVTADTKKHMANELAKELAKLSAKGAR